MRTRFCSALVALLISVTTVVAWGQKEDADKGAGVVVVDFEDMAVGRLPEGFAEVVGGPGQPGKWVVEEDGQSPGGKRVLAQVSTDETGQRFPMCVCEKATMKDGVVSVRFKAVAGETDQAAGVVVRWKDKDNYYVARANALENNVRLYKVVGGRRQQFAGKDVEVPRGKWQTLSLAASGAKFSVGLDGKELFTAEDATFKEAGKVGLWTKADSVTRFDDLRIEAK